MTKLPGAVWRPISRNYTNAKRSHTRAVVLHASAVGHAPSLYNAFQKAGANASAHLHVAKDGTIEQYVDLDKIAWTSASGNSSTIGIETQCSGYEPWTAKQVEAIAKALAWITHHYGLPIRLMTSSSASQRGIGYHRLGIDGNFPSSGLLAGRRQRGGGEVWSGAYGKVCPGDKAIAQMPLIVTKTALAAGAIGGGRGESKPTSTKPRPKPASGRLDTDGYWGPATTKALQKHFGTPTDGVISGQNRGPWNENIQGLHAGTGGSKLIAAIQKRLGVHADGLLGPATVTALQKHYRTSADGVVSSPSAMVVSMQKKLNAGTF